MNLIGWELVGTVLVIHILRINSACSESILNPPKPVSHLGKALGMDRTRYDTSTHTYIYIHTYITLHSIPFHYITLHTYIHPFRSVPFHSIIYITLHSAALHYTTLHYIHITIDIELYKRMHVYVCINIHRYICLHIYIHIHIICIICMPSIYIYIPVK